jgi:hypothetical protein
MTYDVAGIVAFVRDADQPVAGTQGGDDFGGGRQQ